MTNVDLLQRTLTYIETHEDEWDQADWRCDTGMCFAGHAVALAGIPLGHPDNGAWIPAQNIPASVATAMHLGRADAVLVRIEAVARHLLDIDGITLTNTKGRPVSAPWVLFSEDNTLDDLRQIVAELCRTEALT